MKKIIQLLRISAATNERQTVDLSDVLLLKNCLWNHYDNAEKVREIIIKTLQKHSYAVPSSGEISTAEIVQESPAPRRTENKIKGFVGSGTEHDPILIQSLNDLIDISRPDVGTKGYYFKQTADIDCASLTHWTPMDFQGHYDGDGNSIKNLKDNQVVFFTIQANSSVINLKLEGCALVNVIKESQITNCQTDTATLIVNAVDCQISRCKVHKHLVANTATNCQISECTAKSNLVGTATDCKIADCLMDIHVDTTDESFGSIACKLSKDSLVERCFVTGVMTLGRFANFGGIVGMCNSSTIRNCSVGELAVKPQDLISTTSSFVLGNSMSSFFANSMLSSLNIIKDENFFRIAHKTVKPTLENNAAVDTIVFNDSRYKGNDDANSKDGKTLAAAMFNQRYHELTLGWDFENVWEWDEANNQPALRCFSNPETASKPAAATNTTGMEDLLLQQIRNNVWL